MLHTNLTTHSRTHALNISYLLRDQKPIILQSLHISTRIILLRNFPDCIEIVSAVRAERLLLRVGVVGVEVRQQQVKGFGLLAAFSYVAVHNGGGGSGLVDQREVDEYVDPW